MQTAQKQPHHNLIPSYFAIARVDLIDDRLNQSFILLKKDSPKFCFNHIMVTSRSLLIFGSLLVHVKSIVSVNSFFNGVFVA